MIDALRNHFRGLGALTWLETRIFLREPMGAIGTIAVPVLMFVLVGRVLGGGVPTTATTQFVRVGLPVFAAVYIAISAVLSLVTIISIYRESGILKRLRATPLRPHTILTAHVLVKLMLTALTLIATALAGRRYFPAQTGIPWVSFTIAVLISTVVILSIGFVVASVIPTARFAQPFGALVLYPMLAFSGIFIPVSALPPSMQLIARALPLTYVVSLLQGIWTGDTWMAHASDLAALAVVFVICTTLAARIFRWE